MPAIVAQTIDLSQWTPRENGEVWGTDKNGVGGRIELMLDDFESAIFLMPGNNEPIWKLYPNGDLQGRWQDTGTLTFDSVNFIDGVRSLRVTMDAATNEWPRAPYLDLKLHNGTRNHFIREMVTNMQGREWPIGKFNRLTLWVLSPPEQIVPTQQYYGNLTIGTYYSLPSAGGPTSQSDEVGGRHGYHDALIRPGLWTKIVMDCHPDYFRDLQNGNVEPGDQTFPAPTTDPGYTYMDLLTRMYFDVGNSYVDGLGGYSWNFDAMEFWEETNTENVDDLYTPCCSFDSTTNTFYLSWQRAKDQYPVTHEVRYSFFNIHNIGWDNATVLGSSNNSDIGGYNGMRYQTSGINVSGQSVIYFAIKPSAASTFRQIKFEIPGA